jgi:hypothetical protein
VEVIGAAPEIVWIASRLVGYFDSACILPDSAKFSGVDQTGTLPGGNPFVLSLGASVVNRLPTPPRRNARWKGNVKWTQDENGLAVQMPEQKPCDHAIALKIAT